MSKLQTIFTGKRQIKENQMNCERIIIIHGKLSYVPLEIKDRTLCNVL
jgi:hypothetical protein